jgi:2-dehydro-3-deoxygluconokinase
MPELVAGCNIILGNEEDAELVFEIKAKASNLGSTILQIKSN